MTSTTTAEPTPALAWRMLALGVVGQASGTILVSTPAFLIPLLHVQRGLPLAQAGLLAAAPTFGLVLSLVAWGAAADRFGERWVITSGLALTALFAVGALLSPGYVGLAVFLVLAGAASGSTSAASGRVVVGWFPRHRRGLAMGIRQIAQPLGVAVAAVSVPPLAAHFGIAGALSLGLVVNLVLAVLCGLLLIDPPRPARTAVGGAAPVNPYRRNSYLWRIHAVSVLLVLPQFTLSTFGLVWLISGFGWKEGLAGAVIAGSQFIGAAGRIAIGSLSDRVASRVGLLRWVGVAGTGAMGLLALLSTTPWGAAAAVAFVVATTISVADNGLAFTSVAEAAGHRWSGKALGVQNTGQFVAASAVGPGVGALIAAVGFPLAFALVAIAPLLSIPVVPRRDQAAAD
jgi:MFS family permease